MGCNKSRFHADIMDIHDKVTGSCHLCVVMYPNKKKLKFLVDCGLFQGEGEPAETDKLNRKPFPFNSEDLSFVLVTHNHIDHTGRLPILEKNGFNGTIYASEATCNFLPTALTDSFSVMKSNSKKAKALPMYNEENVAKVESLCEPCPYDDTIEITENIRVNFFENAHLPGAAVLLVRIAFPGEEDINILFTGDYNNKSIFQNDVNIPSWVLDLPLTIIQESTYGDTNSEDIEPCFDRNLLKAVEQNWTALVPVISLGRAQQVLYRLRYLQIAGLLDVNVPIYLDGKLTITYTNMYLKGLAGICEDTLDFLPENCTFVDKPLRNILINENNSCKIILTSSGMGSHGPARTYIPAYLGRQKTLIQFTCYVAEGTVGRMLKDVPNGEIANLQGHKIVKRAKVEYTSEFSSHAKADVMIDFLNQFSNLKLVLVNHGEPDVKEAFAKRILKEVNTKAVGILNRDNVFRIGPWGLEKTIPTKFI